MPLKFRRENLEGLNESIAGLYSKADDGNYYLQVEGAVAKSRLDEFRDTNIQLKKDLDKQRETTASWESKYNQLKENAPKKEDYVLKTDVDELLNQRTDKMRKEHEKALKKAGETINVQGIQLSSLLIDSEVRRAATDHKALPTAVDDLILRAKLAFKVEEGKAVPYGKDGKVVYGKDGATPQSVGEWVESLKESAAHLFAGSTGMGTNATRFGNGKGDPSKMSPLQKIASGLRS